MSRSVFGYFVVMASDLVLIKVFKPQTKKITYVRGSDFRIKNKNSHPQVEVLLDGIVTQLEKEQDESKQTAHEVDLLTTFQSAHQILLTCLNSKKKFDPSLPSKLEEASQCQCWRFAIDIEYDALIRQMTP